MARARLERQNRLLRTQVEERFILVAESAAMRTVLDQVERVAATDTRVLISGENGTGKELIARRIHALSGRRNAPFVPVNCAAIPGELIESELFGHAKGAFTGAHTNKTGKFEHAAGGTLFLDEVGDMSLPAQAKVLRALEEGVVEQVGGDRAIRVDTRVVAATNKDLDEEIEQGAFRRDLLYRLRVVPLHIPPLRERKGDIIPLCEHFLAYYSATGKRPLALPEGEVRMILESYPWPGNVRELRNAMERLVIMSTGETITPDDLAGVLGSTSPDTEVVDLPKGIEGLARVLQDEPGLSRFRDEAEKVYLLTVLEEHGWNVKATADALDIQRSNLYRKLDKHGIERGDILEE
jgi:two-component system nitrogen regulation response regulator NtrX